MKKYWDIISGLLAGILLAFLAEFKLDKIQLAYSVIILMLVCVGVMRIIKQAIDTQQHTKKRKPTIIDSMVDGQNSIKAISLAQAPTKYGEKIGKFIITIFRGEKKTMKKIKAFVSKFKGYMLTTALAILTIIEMCGAPINTLFGGALTIKGVAVLPVVTLICTAVVGILSNGYTKEQMEKIKALFSTSNTTELVLAEIKKTIKEKTAQLTQFNKVLNTQENELANFQSEYETLNNTLMAKKEMCAMVPQLATVEDVQLATNAVVSCKAKIEDKKAEIEKTKAMIETLTTTINALKSQIN
jgi:hypothetical protein